MITYQHQIKELIKKLRSGSPVIASNRELSWTVADILYVKERAICKYIRTATCEGCHIDKDRQGWRGVKEKDV